jgi:hypothetical protein
MEGRRRRAVNGFLFVHDWNLYPQPKAVQFRKSKFFDTKLHTKVAAVNLRKTPKDQLLKISYQKHFNQRKEKSSIIVGYAQQKGKQVQAVQEYRANYISPIKLFNV